MVFLLRTRRGLLLLAAGAALLAGCGGDDPPPPAAGVAAPAAAASAVGQGIVGAAFGQLDAVHTELGHAGVRRLGGAALDGHERFIIGSNTKAMTAVVAARLIERGVLRWDTRIAQALPGIALRDDYRAVTLEQLLAHRGGMPAFIDEPELEAFAAVVEGLGGAAPVTLTERRSFFTAWLVQQPPPAGVVPGRTYAYSNAGYVLVAAMLEAATGKPYETLFDEELARPLGIAGSWLRPELAGADQTAGHAGPRGQVQVLAPFEPEQQAWLDVIAPAGLFSTSAADYASWLRWHQRALRGESTPLPAGYVQRLRALNTPGDYAVGWAAAILDGRPVLVHAGHWAGYMAEATVDLAGARAGFALVNVGWFDADGRSWVLDVVNPLLIEMDRHVR